MGLRDTIREILGSGSSSQGQDYQPQPGYNQPMAYYTPQTPVAQQYTNVSQPYGYGYPSQPEPQQPRRHYLEPNPPPRGSPADPNSPNFNAAANLEHYNQDFQRYMRENGVGNPNPQKRNRFDPTPAPPGSTADPRSPNFRPMDNARFHADAAIKKALGR